MNDFLYVKFFLRNMAVISEDFIVIVDSRLLGQLQRKHVCQHWG